jgi:hypothetical protein
MDMTVTVGDAMGVHIGVIVIVFMFVMIHSNASF